MKNAASPLFRNHNRSALEAGTYITHRVIYHSLVYFDGDVTKKHKIALLFVGPVYKCFNFVCKIPCSKLLIKGLETQV